MQMAEQFDISTLAWVKGEIDETLKQARIALEAYVEDPDEDSQLDECVSYVHQVYGTLHMVELVGAALFAEEIEKFALALKQDKIEERDHGFELLMRSILQLPDYLESLLGGQQDNPSSLLPLLNELRSLRGEQGFEQEEYFQPDLSIEAPARKTEPPQGVSTQILAKKVHPYLISSLTKLIKGSDKAASLKTIATVVEKLLQIAEGADCRRMLWVASAFIEALRDGSLELSGDRKTLLGKVEQQVRVLVAKGEEGLEKTALTELVTSHLYHLAHSTANGVRASAVRQAFKLDEEQGEASMLGGMNAELKKTVSADIMDELSRVKDIFDIYVRSDRSNTDNLAPMVDSLSSMADTLSLLQEENLRGSLKEQADVVQRLVAGELEVDDDVMMGIAGSILAVESALRDWGTVAPLEKADAEDEQVSEEETSPEAIAEHQRVTRQVMKEAREDLIRMREAVNAYLEKPEEKAVLGGIQSLLHQVIGSLSILSYKRVAQVLTACGEFVEHELVSSDTIPEAAKLDALADAVMSIEYYLEAFVQSRVHPGSVLEVAESAVAKLGYSEVEEPEIEEHQAAGDVVESESVTEEIELSLEEPLAPEETIELAPIDEPEEELALELESIIPEEPEEEIAIEAVSIDEPQQEETSAPARGEATVEVDDEILEIFVEEAEEELERIGELLPKWTADPGDSETLKELRRSFHTLKGSGRLVGALEVGEFAWAFENMLNRVLDGSLSSSATMFDILEQAYGVLPQLIERFKGSDVSCDDAEMLRQMAEDMAQPGGAQVPEPEPVTSEAESVEAATEAVEQALPELDPVLLEIYQKEAEGHLEVITGFVQEARDGGNHKVKEPLIRALHTLKGSSNMAGIHSVSDVSVSLEKYCKTLQALHEKVDDNGLLAMDMCVDFTNAMLAYLQDNSLPFPDNSEAKKLADEVYAEVQHLEHVADAQPEGGLASVEEVEEPTVPVEEAKADIEEPVAEELLSIEPEGDELLEAALDAAASEEPPVGESAVEEIELLEEPASEPDVELEFEAEPEAELPQTEVEAPAAEAFVPDEDYDQELLEIFLEEGVDILDASEQTLQEWVENPGDRALVEALQRQLHTLKGGARMAGIAPIGDLSHSLESTFDLVVDGVLDRSTQMVDLLQLSHDRLVTMLEQVRNHEPVVTGDDLIAQVDALSKPQVAPTDSDSVGQALEILEPGSEGSDSEKRLGALAPLLEQLAESQVKWQRDVNDSELFATLQAAVDNLDTACHASGVTQLSDIADALQVLVSAIGDGHVIASEKVSDLISVASERMHLIQNQYHAKQPLDNGEFVISSVREMIAEGLAREDAIHNETVVEIEAAKKKEADKKEQRRKAPRVQQEVVRVRAELLDNLVNYAGEVSIYRSRVEQQIGSFGLNLEEMDQTIDRLRIQLRQVEIETEAQIDSRRAEAQKQGYDDFDPLEFDRFTNMQTLSRSMAESLNDLLSIEDMLRILSRETETLLLQQSRVNTELQESLMHTRMVPLVENAPRLRRVIRQTASELGKRTSLSFDGADVEMDRNVVERMMAPLEHMLRNSIAHGIESKAQRKKAGKPAEGKISIALSREGSEIVINVTDDGAGIDLEAVKEKAIDRGLIQADSQLSDQEIMHFILESGFSTAASLSQVAGRGVGMDVVNSEIKQLGGVLEIDSEFGKGTTFTIRLPLTLSVSRALLIYVGEDVYAIPLPSISGIERITGAELDGMLASENPTYNWVGEDYSVLHLNKVLGVPAAPLNLDGKQPIILTHSGGHRIAFVVDSLIGSREIVVKSLGPQLSNLQDLAGATILADGSVALIIDMPSLVRRGVVKLGVEEAAEELAHVVEREPVVMVVDDSITVRKVTERLLKRHNMKCVQAKDGVDAIAALDEVIPDVMLLDIEMPRMDGFELATHIRNTERLKQIPIIMITSRTGDKHRERAMSIGVNEYMGKPYTEVDLLENIEKMLDN